MFYIFVVYKIKVFLKHGLLLQLVGITRMTRNFILELVSSTWSTQLAQGLSYTIHFVCVQYKMNSK